MNISPKLRFAECTHSYKKQCLGDIYTEKKEKGDSSLPILSVSIHTGISNKQLSDDENDRTVRRSEDKSLYKRVEPGDLVFNMMRAWQGAIGVAKIKGMVSPAYIVARPNNYIEPIYMEYLLRTYKYIESIRCASYGVTDFRLRLYWNAFEGIKIHLPSRSEQQKIASFLSLIDAKIDKQRQKIDALEEYKKGLLQKIFTQEIRFKDDDGNDYPDWNDCELNKACIINPNCTTLPDRFNYIDLECVQSGNLVTDPLLIEKTSAPSRAQRLLCNMDILFQTVRPYQMNNYFFENCSDFPVVASTGYAQLRTTMNNPRFIFYCIHNSVFIRDVLARCTGTSYPAINSNDLGDIVIRIPSISEQNKIANLFLTFDIKLKNEKEVLGLLCQFKKGLLQQMFV